jgi:two-component system NarL family sensor kinase
MTGSNCWCFESFLDGDFVSQNVDVIECSRLRKAANTDESDLTAGMKYHASVGLRVGARLLGIMNLSGPHWRALDERDLHLLSALGAHVGMAVDRAHLSESAARLARTEERTRLARDIHDTLAQDLTAIALQLEGALRQLRDGDGEARARIEKALAVTREALSDARESVLTLRSDPLGGKPLASALAALARGFTSETGIIATFDDRAPATLAHAAEVALFRIASEALTNVRRHAGARRVELSLGGDGAAIALRIDDDGCGLAPGASDGRYGIVGMQERAAVLGGTFAIGPRPGGGTRVEVRVPVTA